MADIFSYFDDAGIMVDMEEVLACVKIVGSACIIYITSRIEKSDSMFVLWPVLY